MRTMDRSSNDNSPIENVYRAARPVVLLAGQAGSGKTAAALDLYHRYCEPVGRPGCLLIVPNSASVAAIQRKMLARSQANVLAWPQVLTFAALADRVLKAAGSTGRLLGTFRRRVLLRQIVDELAADRKLTALAPVADTGGLIVALDRAIAELKRAAVEPDALAKAVGRARGKSRDLLAIYHRYQAALVETDRYDVEGQMWQAREILSQADGRGEPLPGLDDVRAVAVDGFTDFTPTQLAMLRLICGRAERGLITLPLADDGREKMWHWTRRTAERVRETFGDDLCEIPAEPLPADSRKVWDDVFDFDATVGELPATIHITAATSIETEVASTARRVKQALLNGSPAGSIAVLARSVDEYRPTIERVFAAHGIPIAPAAALLTEVPIVRLLLASAEISPKFEFHNVLRVIGNSYFRPGALGPFDDITVLAAQTLIREGNVLAGRDSYAQSADRMAKRKRRQVDYDDDAPPVAAGVAGPDDYQAAAHMLDALFDLSASAGDATGLRKLIDAMQLTQAAMQAGSDENIARDLRALAQLRELLSALPDEPLSADHVREALCDVACPAARGESTVDLLGVLDARAIRYERVFLLGLNEKHFPRSFVESSLIGEGDRAAWQSRGVRLDSRGDLTAREMLLFYLAVSRSDGELSLSYLESDSSGRATAASGFLLSLLEPFGGLDSLAESDRIERILPGRFVLDECNIARPRDALNAAVAGLFSNHFSNQSSQAPGALAWAIDHADQQMSAIAGGLLAMYRRNRPGQPDRFDGRITDQDLLDHLSIRYPGGTVFSASKLNRYGQCPWQFFANYVLKLKPLLTPQRQLEPVTRGLFVHDVLFVLFSRLRSRADGPFRLSDFDAADLAGDLQQAVDACAAEIESTRPPYPVLWQIQKTQAHQQISEYLRSRRGRDDEPVHLHFELGFGVDTNESDRLDPATRPEPICLDTPAGEVRIEGRIDRVDRLGEGNEGLFVVDYKTGRPPTHADLAAGRNLQLPIYTEAVERILASPSMGGAFHRIGDNSEWHFSAVKPPRGDKRTFAERRSDAIETIGTLVAGMAAGRFDALPTHKCPAWCTYRQVCQYSPARAERKTAEGER